MLVYERIRKKCLVIPMYHFTMDLELYDPAKRTSRSMEEYVEKAEKVLEFIFEKLNGNRISISCFVTNEFVENFYEIFHEKIVPYHDVGCHTSNHLFYDGNNKEEFIKSIRENKGFLEKEIGRECSGFRAPSCILPEDMTKHLIKLGFKYDSSVVPGIIPGRLFRITAPKVPYYPQLTNIYRRSEKPTGLVEFPLGVLPVLRLSVNGFFYPYFMPLLSRRYERGYLATYVHASDFIKLNSQKFIWDRLSRPERSRELFLAYVEKYRGKDATLLGALEHYFKNKS